MTTLMIFVLCFAALCVVYAILHRGLRSREVRRTDVIVVRKRVMRVVDSPVGAAGPNPPRRIVPVHLVTVRMGDEEHEVAVDLHTYSRLEPQEPALLTYRIPWKGSKADPVDIIPAIDA